MTILAVCGPIGSNIKSFSQKCFDLLDPKKVILFDASTYSKEELSKLDPELKLVQELGKDIIIFGPHIFAEEQLRSKFDIKVFIALDDDLCLANHMKLSKKLRESDVPNAPVSSDPTELLEVVKQDIHEYEKTIREVNESIRLSGRFADFVLPQNSSGERLLNLLVDDEKKTLINPGKKQSVSPVKDKFWQGENVKSHYLPLTSVSLEFS